MFQEIVITGPRTAELLEDRTKSEPGETQALARTLVSLTSPGTELQWHYLARDGFPRRPGYAAIVEVERMGDRCEGAAPGDRLFCTGTHASHQIIDPPHCVPVPVGLSPETAVFCRLAAVCMTTLVTTKARPPGRVLVMGLGPVGHLAAQVFSTAGYRVEGYDPFPSRRSCLETNGVRTLELVEAGGVYDLVLECSGSEEALKMSLGAVRAGGEVVMIGVPWGTASSVSAHEILELIFHRYVHLRSGWEWELPWDRQEFGVGSIRANLEAALGWLADSRLRVDGLSGLSSPEDCQRVYDELLDRSHPFMAAMFDWRRQR